MRTVRVVGSPEPTSPASARLTPIPELPMRRAARNTAAASAPRSSRPRRGARSALFKVMPLRPHRYQDKGVLASSNLLEYAIPGKRARPGSRRARPVADSDSFLSGLIDSDGFPSNVGIVLMHREQVFLGRRTGGRGWQFPQGGVRAGEAPEQAMYRELDEEIGLDQSKVELVGHTGEWLRYRLPARYIRRNQRPVCIGQKQRWFLLRMKSAEVLFDF